MKKQAFIFLSGLMWVQLYTVAIQAQSSKLLPVTDFAAKIEALPTAPIIDIRTPEEYAKGHIPNAINVNWLSGEFEKQSVALDPALPVLLYCLGGGRSASATLKMKEMGFREIYELEGGLLKWRAAGMPEEMTNYQTAGISTLQFQEMLQMKKLVLIVFYADWCGQCNKLKPIINETVTESAGNLTAYWINVDDNRDLVKAMGIDAIPVIHIYRDQSLIWSHTGFIDKIEVLDNIQ
jgi:rhodanese-related sulfurtransferase